MPALRWIRRLAVCALVATLMQPCHDAHAATVRGADAPGYRIVRRIPMTDGWWDYASFDPVHRRLFVSRGNGVMRLDVKTGAIDPQIIPGSEGRASVVLPGGDEVLSVLAGWGKAVIFTAAEGKVKSLVDLAQVPDAAIYDPATRLAWVMGRHGEATLIDPATGTIAGIVEIGGLLEFNAVDGKGRLFVNVTDKAQIAVVDTRRRKLVTHFALQGCEAPSGLAYVASAGLLLSACANRHTKVLRASDGAEIADLATGEDPDAVIYDPRSGLAFVPSAADGMLSVIAVRGPRDVRVIEHDRTQIGTRTGAVDPETGTLYLPTARFGAPNKFGFPEPLPGSVELLVLRPSG